MKNFKTILMSLCLVSIFCASATAQQPPTPLPPDLDKPITMTLRKVQAIVSASVAQAAAQSAAQAAKADLDDMIKQATPVTRSETK